MPDARGVKTSGGWFHVDQGRLKLGRHCVQGMVSLYDANAHTGGLCLIPGSHKHFERVLQHAVWDIDFVPLPPRAALTKELTQRSVVVSCKAGDLILWDSRTVHCNSPALLPPSPETGQPLHDLLRAVLYTCFTPRTMASDTVLRRRREALVCGVGTSHWPHEFRPIVPFPDGSVLVTDEHVNEAMLRSGICQENISLVF